MSVTRRRRIAAAYDWLLFTKKSWCWCAIEAGWLISKNNFGSQWNPTPAPAYNTTEPCYRFALYRLFAIRMQGIFRNVPLGIVRNGINFSLTRKPCYMISGVAEFIGRVPRVMENFSVSNNRTKRYNLGACARNWIIDFFLRIFQEISQQEPLLVTLVKYFDTPHSRMVCRCVGPHCNSINDEKYMRKLFIHRSTRMDKFTKYQAE